MNVFNSICLIACTIPSLLLGQEIPNDLEQEIQRRVSLDINPSVSICILLPDNEVRFYNYGQYNAQNHQKADSLTLYEIGSITKTFTATLCDHHLSKELNTSLSALFPEIDNTHLAKIILSELRNHIAGMPRLSEQFSPKNWSDPFNGYSDSLLTIELQALKPDTSRAWHYSNFGYGVLGKAIEKTTQRAFEDLMGELIHQAEMSNTLLKHRSGTTQNLAQPTNIGTQNSYWHFSGPSRYAGGLVSCTKDLINYLKYQKNQHPLFKSASIEQLIQTGIQDLGKDQLFYKDGWFVLKPDSHNDILLHNGGTGGFTSFIAYNKNTKIGVVILSNAVSLMDDIGLKLIYSAFKLKRPERTIAYELADSIERGNVRDLVSKYEKLKNENYPDNILNIYWLERYFFGQGNYTVSNQLSDIMVKVLPDDWEVMDIKGQNLERLKRYKEAAEAYQKALLLNPENELLKKKIQYCLKMR
ncbi:MAG: serine hydrolase [Thermonemataceae bacterium]